MNIKSDRLACLQRAITVHLNSRVLGKDILASTLGTDKSKNFGIIEPFNSTCLHAFTSFARELSKREVRLFGRYECKLIKTPSIHLYTLVKSKRASSHPTGAAQSSVSKFYSGNAIDGFHAGLLLQIRVLLPMTSPDDFLLLGNTARVQVIK